MTQPETPFPRHWLYYIALKVVVIAVAVAVALKFLGIVAREAYRSNHVARTPLLFDTTLRDGAQTRASTSRCEDKRADRARCSTRSASTTSRAAGPAPIRPTPRSSPSVRD